MKKTKTAKRLLAMLFVLALLAGFVPITAAAAEPYTGQAAQDEYTISDEAGLQALATAVNGGENYYKSTFTLTADLDLSSVCGAGVANWTPIGTSSNMFMGTFDGGGHTISNLYYNGTATDGTDSYIGLFGFLGYNTSSKTGVVKNLHLTGVSLTGYQYVGGIFGYSSRGTVSSCCVEGSVTASGTYAGGIGGSTYIGTSNRPTAISDCYVAVSLSTTATEGYTGGIVGTLTKNSSIQNCYATGSINAPSSGNIGGLVGAFSNTSSSTKIMRSFALQEQIDCGSMYVGRITGDFGSGSAEDCYALSTMTTSFDASGDATASGKNGADMSAAQALASTIYTDMGWPGYDVSAAPFGWQLVDGQLPYIQYLTGGRVTAAYIAAPELDIKKIVLLSKITEAETLRGSIPISADGSDISTYAFWVTQGAFDAFNGVIAAAQGVYDNSSATLGDVNTQITNLEAASVTFESSKQPGTKYVVADELAANYDTSESYGTPETALEIDTAENLLAFADFVNATSTHHFENKYVKLTDDIDLSTVCGPALGNWLTIGNEFTNYFCGTFDGCGHTVSNLYSHDTADPTFQYLSNGLFGNVMYYTAAGAAGTIKNIFLEDVDIEVEDGYAGGIVANLTGGASDRAAVSGCTVTGSIKCVANSAYLGGVVGTITAYTDVSDCSFSGSISDTGSTSGGGRYGGITGAVTSHSATFTNCYATGTITTAVANTLGGIVGSISNGTITACFALQSSISDNADTSKRILGSGDSATLSNCYAWEGTEVNGSTVTSDDAASLDGESIIASAALSGATYSALSWDGGIWTLTDNDKLPYITDFGPVDTALYTYLTSPAVKLSAPTGLAWDGTTPGKATWSAVANVSSYTVQLLKDGVTSGSAVTGITVTEYDFTSAIASAGTGSYTFTVTAIGDGTNYTDSDAATVGTAYSYTSPAVKLSAPTGLAWDGTTPGKATWSAVANVSSYTVQLLKDGVTSGSAVTGITVTEYDFTSAIASAGTGSYTFTVTAIGDGTNYTDSDAATVGTAYSYTSPAVKLSAPTGLAWDGTTPGKATWSAVANVSSYTVQLLKDGVTSGSAVTGITVTEYDFTSAIASAGTGSYTFTVTAIGDGTNYTDSDAATVGTAYSYTSPAVKLSAPTGLAWDGTTPGKATWSAVANASSYTVQLLKDGVTSGSAVTGITVIEYDFTSAIASAGTGSYTFTVTTSGDGTNYTDSDAATVGTAYSYTSPAGSDTTSPTLTNAYVSNKSATGATINFTSDEAGTYYYVLYLATEAAPDAATVKTGTSGAAIAGANSFNATGLAASTAYTAYVIVTDAANNTSTVADIDFTTTVAYYPGGTGGGSGNGATTGSATSNKVNPGATSSNGTATVQVSETSLSDTIKYAQENNSGSIVIAPEITGSASTVNVVIPGSSLMEIASQTKADLVLDTPAGSMTIPNNTLASVASQANGGTVTMSLGTADTSALTPEQQSAVGSDPVYDISIMSGGENISSFGGASLTITLPYTLQAGEDPDGVSVWYLNDAGELAQMPCTYDAATGTVSFTTDHLSYYVIAYDAIAAWVNPYGDVRQTDWFYDAVAFVSANGLFTGTGASVFSPDTEMTRTMLVTVLYRLEGEPRVSGTSAFADVKDGMWYTDAVVWANANGIVTGYDNGLFGTDDSITREQMAAILYRYAQFKGYDVTASASLTAYADSMDLSDWAGAAMRWANAEELITGMTSETLVPGGSATRAQVAIILMRFAERFAG